MKRRVLVGLTAAAFAGAVMVGLACGGAPASSSSAVVSGTGGPASLPVPRPIAGGDYFGDLPHHRAGIFHQWYPILPPNGDGIWAEPNEMTDFNGFVAQMFQGGTATDSDGKQYVVDVDNRIYVGEYIGTNGEHAVGAFCGI